MSRHHRLGQLHLHQHHHLHLHLHGLLIKDILSIVLKAIPILLQLPMLLHLPSIHTLLLHLQPYSLSRLLKAMAMIRGGWSASKKSLMSTPLWSKCFGGNTVCAISGTMQQPSEFWYYNFLILLTANGGEENLPNRLEELTEKEFVFQIHVTPFNFTPNQLPSQFPPSLKIPSQGPMARLSNLTCRYGYCLELLFKAHVHVSQEHGDNTLSSNDGDVGLEASPSGPSVLGDKVSEECATADPPEISDAQNNRKHRRE
ncbi:hypothetical protein HID58_032873 [Brassica napus]|uniref:BnaA09g11900D protein n=3 Tax=Brassica TaxID=3705 RepID=A0A078HLH7_BRANA|nr:hypothetical protein HID58_032873 [Brassica napus]CAF2039564.1 unnamed protein product [Brassica napus]CAG7861144.1 unnamed protein product [Brassica rapa]CDY38199.1 BnaA09g11900D [Brassica napus]VDC59537.1 unnamed protein product [Brassica rapa]